MSKMQQQTIVTKKVFANAVRNHLIVRYAWATEKEKLDRFMNDLNELLNHGSKIAMFDSFVICEVWRELGCEGEVTYMKLLSLPA